MSKSCVGNFLAAITLTLLLASCGGGVETAPNVGAPPSPTSDDQIPAGAAGNPEIESPSPSFDVNRYCESRSERVREVIPIRLGESIERDGLLITVDSVSIFDSTAQRENLIDEVNTYASASSRSRISTFISETMDYFKEFTITISAESIPGYRLEPVEFIEPMFWLREHPAVEVICLPDGVVREGQSATSLDSFLQRNLSPDIYSTTWSRQATYWADCGTEHGSGRDSRCVDIPFFGSVNETRTPGGRLEEQWWETIPGASGSVTCHGAVNLDVLYDENLAIQVTVGIFAADRWFSLCIPMN